MKKSKVVRNLLLGSTAILSVAINTGLRAEDAPAADDDGVKLEEILVTARKRSENLMDVPDSITALSSSTIERANITEARDIVNRVPNVSIVESLSPTSTYLIVRGIATTRNTEPAVAVVVDGVQVGSASEISQSFYDVEQIEMLKGPQGALYGRNAIGGALIITSKKPTSDFTGKLSAGIGDNGWYEVGGYVSGPISDNLFFRVAGSHKSFDGTIVNEYLEHVLANATEHISNELPDSPYMDFVINNDFRAQLLWEPSAQTSVDLRYAVNDLESGAMWYRNIYRMESDNMKTYDFGVNSNGNPTAFRNIKTHTLKVDHQFDFADFQSITNYTDTSERYGVAGETRGHDRTANVWFFTQWSVDNFMDTLTPGSVDHDYFTANLGANIAGDFVGSDQYYDIETISQEFRFTSKDNEKFNWVAGAYFLKTDRTDTIRATWEKPFGEPFDCPGVGETDFNCNGLLFSTQNKQDNKAWALFFSADYDISDKLTLTAAGRYDQDKRRVTRIDGPTVDTFGLGIGAVGGDCDSVADPDNCAASGSQIEDTFSAFQPKFSLAYKPTEDLTVYATYARGFRSGGFNASGALLTDVYDTETLDSFELGAKATFLDGRLRTSVAGFMEKLHNSQQFEFDGNIFVQSLYNIPESKIHGIEGSIDFAVTSNLTMGAAFGIMDSEITDFNDDIYNKMLSELTARMTNTVLFRPETQKAFDNGLEGGRLPLFAHKTANVYLQHDLPLSNNRYLTTRIDYNYMGDRNWWIDGQDIQENVSIVDASIGLEIAENTELVAWCKNCFDKVYDSEYSSAEKELFGGAMKEIGYQARLRTFGVKLNYKF